MNSDDFINFYWQSYEFLEQDFIDSIRYVYLNNDNLDTYSIYYARLLQDICSECESIMRAICRLSDKTKYNIVSYFKKILKKYPELFSEKVSLNKYLVLNIIPFKKIEFNKIPEWWDANNCIKHNKKSNIKKANQKNVLYALAGLYILEMILISEYKLKTPVGINAKDSKIFNYSKNINFFYQPLLYEVCDELD